MVQTKKFEQMIDIIPKNKVILETDSPFGRVQMNYKSTLTEVNNILNKIGIDCWENFVTLTAD